MFHYFCVAALVCGFGNAEESSLCNEDFKNGLLSDINNLYSDVQDLKTCSGNQGAAVNLAQGKKTTMSKQWGPGVSSRAVDGNWNPIWGGNSCTHTQRLKNPYWQVDLGQDYDVTEVWVQNRADCCAQRLNHVVVSVGQDENNLKVCAKHIPAVGRGQVVIFKCAQPITGRYVRVQTHTVDYLTLCEVAVFGN